MLELDYLRWGIFKSKLMYFGDLFPCSQGYHFIMCLNCYSELPYNPLMRWKLKPTVVINLNKDINDIFNSVHKNRRKNIKRGLKIPYKIIHVDNSFDILSEFRRLYNTSIVKKNATPILSLNYFKSLLPFLTFFKIIYNNTTLDLLVLLHDGHYVLAHYIAHNESAKIDYKVRYYAQSVLCWEVIKYFHQLGFNLFDFGSINLSQVSQPKGFTNFKISFGGEIVPTYSYEAPITASARISLELMKKMERIIRKL